MRNRILVGSVLMAGAMVLGAAPASAHSQSVQPAAHEEPVVAGPISRPFAQAHCHSAAPAVHVGHPVVSFSPAEALACTSATVNPGGQVHPHAVAPTG